MTVECDNCGEEIDGRMVDAGLNQYCSIKCWEQDTDDGINLWDPASDMGEDMGKREGGWFKRGLIEEKEE